VRLVSQAHRPPVPEKPPDRRTVGLEMKRGSQVCIANRRRIAQSAPLQVCTAWRYDVGGRRSVGVPGHVAGLARHLPGNGQRFVLEDQTAEVGNVGHCGPARRNRRHVGASVYSAAAGAVQQQQRQQGGPMRCFPGDPGPAAVAGRPGIAFGLRDRAQQRRLESHGIPRNGDHAGCVREQGLTSPSAHGASRFASSCPHRSQLFVTQHP
jgi:hypothetical protein